MKIIVFLYFTLLALMPGCNNSRVYDTKSVKADYEISPNDSFQIILDSNPSTGYAWQWTNKTGVSKVDTIGHNFMSNSEVLVGAGGKEIWIFKGLMSGIDSINLEYCRLWEPNSTVQRKKIIVKVK